VKTTLFDQRLQDLLLPTVTALGYELIGVERLSQGKQGSLVRIIIDHPEGIKIEDCERVSHQVSGLLEVENPIRGQYTLEVSSPGWDRPLFTLTHFEQFIGHQVNVQLRRPLNERRKFKGLLQTVENEQIIIVVDGVTYHLPFEQIDKARLVPE